MTRTRRKVPVTFRNRRGEHRPLASVRSRPLAALTSDFDALMTRMQTSRARKGMQEAFEARPAELGRASVAAARRRG
jgi:hypothetical protein